MTIFNLTPTQFRVTVFISLSIIFLFWERIAPLKKLVHNYKREKANIFLFLFGIVSMRLFMPVGLFYFEEQSHYQIELIDLSHPIMTYLILDFALYWQHRWSHEINWLWKLHRVHHYDHELTYTTGFRFHPVEIVLSGFYKLSICILFKLDPLTILVFETILNSASLFTHSNIQIYPKLRKWISLITFTPHLHHIHHSKISSEQRSNYGFILTLWDKVFRSYIPEKDIKKIELGVKDVPEEQSDDIWYLMRSPLN